MKIQFRIRSLFVVMTVIAIFSNPAYDFYLQIKAKLQVKEQVGITIPLPEFVNTSVTTVVTVPDGGTVICSGLKRPR